MQSFPLLLDPPGKPDYQAIPCPMTNFGPLLRGSVTNLILITAVTGSLVTKILPILNVAP